MIYLVLEHYYNGEEYEDSFSSTELKQGFDSPEKCQSYIRYQWKKVRQNFRKKGKKVRITSDEFGVYCTITGKWSTEFYSWTVDKLKIH